MAVGLDITNNKYGFLTVIELIPLEKRKNSYQRREWLCQCDCGNQVIVEQRHLSYNASYMQQSCGCIRKKEAFYATNKKELSREFIYSFNDFERFLFLHKTFVKNNTSLSHKDVDFYYIFIDYFYNDIQFNSIYSFWERNKNKDQTFYDWAKPSLDHQIPKSRGGTDELNNLQFLTVFENLSKRDMTFNEWNLFLKETNSSSDYFVNKIMEKKEEGF